MADDSSGYEAPTRRDYMKYGGAVVGGSLLAGCAGQSDSGSTPTETETNESSDTDTSTPENESYSVTMSPVGTVEFDGVPETSVAYDNQWADHLVALGQQDGIVALGHPDGFYKGFYDQLPGVEFTPSERPSLFSDGLNKELLYEVDADVHHIDPIRVTTQPWSGFDMDDVNEIIENIGPWFANRFSNAHKAPESAENYQYYSLWELVDKFAEVYQVQRRGQALKQVRDEMLEQILAELPPEEDRPSVALVTYEPKQEAFGPYNLNGPGFGRAHTRPLNTPDALAEDDFEDYQNTISMEAMLEYDPDVMLHIFDWNNLRDRTEAFFDLDSHPVGREISAVQNDRLYASGSGFQGPIMNLFQLELSARQIYPDLFGQPPEPGNASGLGELFDPQRVADIINGDI